MLAATVAQDKRPPLKTGVDGTFAPHAMPKLGGGIEGFQIDLFTEVGAPHEAGNRLRRGELLDPDSRHAVRPLRLIAAPTTVTKERAENMLFTAGYLWTAFQFGIKKGTPPNKGWEDLKGKSVSVNKGTPYETLSKQMGEKYGSPCRSTTPSPTPRRPCSSGRAYATWAATRRSSMPRRRIRNSSPTSSSRPRAPIRRRRCRKDSVGCATKIEEAIECMKKDGTIASPHEKWFG